MFALFDRILLMAEGRVAFLGSTRGALEFFARSVHAPREVSLKEKVQYG